MINNDIEGLEKQMNLLQSRIENLVEVFTQKRNVIVFIRDFVL